MFVGSVYWYLFNDVVPAAFLGRFMAWFRAVGTLSGALYNYFIFQFAQSHMREIYLGASVLYFVGFGLMCLMVKERDYPPPDDAGLRPSLLRDIRTMARDCYTTRFYWDIFLATMFGAVGGSIGTFNVFFHLSLGLDLNQIGKLGGIGMVVVAGAMVFIGPLVDRWHPVRVMAYGTAAGAFIALNNWVWLFAEVPSSTFYFWAMVGVLPFTVWHSALAGAAGLPREMMLFPRDRFGQFCGAQALVRSAGTMIGGLVAGYYIDLMKLRFPTGNYVYRWNFVWSGLFVLVAFAFHYRAYRAWKRLGAEEGYQPPERNFRLADLPPRPETAGAKPLLALLFALLILGQAGLAVAYAVAHWRGGQSFLVPVFATQAVLQLALFAAYFAFIRFMERP
jgi:MFS family permease